ncbi:hypothetical protein FH972_026717 [Carpinus fangiana]|uniref:Uncharacterized protein n=1 Tax=Carpinus fangiana TaxID=176857 RepID=A0A5N6L583_9ROSI|nr:hypothetical protein FH972_026717 [Carpinus fangiana]
MGVLRRLVRLTVYGGVAGTGAWMFTTRKSRFVPVEAADPIFRSASYLTNNPNRNPATQDCCVRKVPLDRIRPSLLEREGKLAEAFSAGVWSGSGYAVQRAYMERQYRKPETEYQLWDHRDLAASTYDVGTEITDHFQVVDKTKDHITVRGGDTPRTRGVRDSDGLFEMSAKINREEGVAEFGLKSVFYQGLGATKDEPMPAPIAFLHRLYSKLLMETSVRSLTI